MKTTLNTFIAFLLFLSLSLNAWAQGGSLSEKYSSFDQPSVERQSFVEEQNRLVAKRIKTSGSFASIKKKVYATFDKERVLQTEEYDGVEYKIVDPGLGKAQRFAAVIEGVEKEIFSTYSIRKDNSLGLQGFVLNPKHDKAALVLNLDGSLDDFVFVVIDLKTGKNLTKTYIKYWGDSDFIYWNNDTELLVNQKNDQDKEDLVAYSFATERVQKKIKMKNQTISMVMNNSWVILADPKEDNIFYSRDLTFNYTIPKGYSVVAEKDGVFYLSNITKLTDREFTTYYTLKKGEKSLTEIAKIEGNVTTQFVLDNFLAVLTVNGPQFHLNGVDLEKKISKKIAIPNFVAATDVAQKEAFKGTSVFQVSVVSDTNKDYTLDWDFTKNHFIDLPSVTEFKEKVLTNGSLSLNVEYKYVRSFDGTLIPLRLVYKAGTALKDRQVYMETYGGFLIDGYSAPMQDHMRLEFVKRGGVYIGTAVRGGNEYGQKWHDQAVKENKIKVVEDLASIAKWVVESKLAAKENIVSAGSSNGGFVVSLAGLLYPQYFGMVIAHNGVLDLLVKEKLDKRNEGGWIDEFGDSTNPNERGYVVKISPLENAAKLKDGPRFFLINAQNDSRVNPAHTIKFAKAASELGPNVNVEFYSTAHSGHFNLDPNYNDVVGANALSVKWATIFDYFGLDYFL